MAKWGFSIRIDILRQIAAVIVIDFKRRNVWNAADSFDTILEDSEVSLVQEAADPKTGLLDVSCMGVQWYR
jgi:hypothetical protein